MDLSRELEDRAALHAALALPHRLGIVDELTNSDRSPSELGRRLGLTSNLVAHHLDVLSDVGLIERVTSSGDRRQRYVRLRHDRLADLALPYRAVTPDGPALFLCTANSARSQLAAALWTERTGRTARSAGTEPADAVHPGALRAAERAGFDLGPVRPRAFDPGEAERSGIVVTVCDQAFEALPDSTEWWHWSTPDPVPAGTDEAFDAVLAELDARIRATGLDVHSPPVVHRPPVDHRPSPRSSATDERP